MDITLTSAGILMALTILGGLLVKAYIDPVKLKTDLNATENQKMQETLKELEKRMRAQETHSSEHGIRLDLMIETVNKLCEKLDKFIERGK